MELKTFALRLCYGVESRLSFLPDSPRNILVDYRYKQVDDKQGEGYVDVSRKYFSMSKYSHKNSLKRNLYENMNAQNE